jgi:hypothetical protein
MRLPSTPWEFYRPGLFRLAGYGGAALFLRSGVLGGDPPRLTLDVGFLTPTDYVWFMRQPMMPGLTEELAHFFFACANDIDPELSVDAVVDPLSGLSVRVLSSTPAQVEMQVEVGADDGEGVKFLTSRVALTRAADQIRLLEAALVEPDSTDW